MTSRVLILQQGAPGGIGRFELLLQRALQFDESDVGIISRSLPPREFVETRRPTRARLVVATNPLLFGLRAVWEAVVSQPDVIVYTHVNVARIHLALRWLRPRARTVLVTHGIEIWRPLSWVKRYALGTCSQIVTLSRFVARSLDAAQGKRHAPVAVVPAGLSDEWSAGIVSRHDTTSRGTVLIVGRLWDTDRQKGVDRVVQAFPKVLERVPEGKLRIVGDGSDRGRLQQLAIRLGIAHRVEFLGAVDDASLRRAYATSDVFALPSLQEGFGLVYLEAMAHGLPCVVAEGTAGAEVVESGVTGLGVPPDDVDQLAEAITSLLTDRAQWSRMSRAASASFQERYREDAFGRRIRSVLLGMG